jgi:hypothetical protein
MSVSANQELRRPRNAGLQKLLSGIEGDEKDSDVIVASFGVGCVNQSLTGGGKTGLSGAGWNVGQNGGDFLVRKLASKAVRSKQVKISGLWMVALNVSFNRRLRPYSASDQVTHGRLSGLLRRNLAGSKLLFDQGVILGELFKIPATSAVTTAIADMDKPESSWIGGTRISVTVPGRSMQQRNQRRTHTGQLRRLAALLIHSMICSLNSSVEACLGAGLGAAGGGRNHMCEKGVGREMTCYLPASCSAHSIANNKSTRCRRSGARILVAATDLPAVREHSVDEFVGCHL